MKKFAFSLAAGSFVAAVLVATPVFAQTGLTEAQIEAVVNLVSSFGADDSIVKNVEASLRGEGSSSSAGGAFKIKTSTSTTTPSTADWIKLKSFLKIGSSGDDVRILQKLLASDPALYPEGLVTGFFGSLTELAVKRLQAKLKIDQVGAIGPQTLAKINELLAGITSEDLSNSRVKIEIKIKDGKEEITFEVKCDSSGSGNVCKEDEDNEDEDDVDSDEGDGDDSDDDDDD